MENRFETVEDFAADEDFQDFCLKPNSARRAKWRQYMKDHPEQLDMIREARQLVEMLHVPLAHSSHTSRTSTSPAKKRSWWPAVAASLLALVVLGIAFQKWLPSTAAVALQQERMSLTGEMGNTTYTLPDQSKVVLREGATISWMNPWTKSSKREVWLEGEAFFDVQHDPMIGQASFDVHLDDGSIQVLGTSFLVKPQPKDLSILLATGKIAYRSRGNTYHLKPGDHLQQSTSSISIQHDVNVEDFLLWQQKGISFSGETIAQVVRQLNQSFDLDIRIGRSDLRNKKISASISQSDPQLLLEAIATIYDIQIIRQGDQITLK
ncbi:MAG: FecR domain-containing protein [Bacteroidota bacterium]